MAYREEAVAGAETNRPALLVVLKPLKNLSHIGSFIFFHSTFLLFLVPISKWSLFSRYTFDQATYLGPLSRPHLFTRQISHPAGHHFLPHYRDGRGGTAEKEDCFVLVHVSRFRRGLNDVKWKRNISDSAVFLGQWSNVSKCNHGYFVQNVNWLYESMSPQSLEYSGIAWIIRFNAQESESMLHYIYIYIYYHLSKKDTEQILFKL